jgi:hypothetical protein
MGNFEGRDANNYSYVGMYKSCSPKENSRRKGYTYSAISVWTMITVEKEI